MSSHHTHRSHSSAVRFALAAAAIAVLCGGAYLFGTSTTTWPGPLVVDPASLNFGEVWEEKHFEWRLRIANISKEPIRIMGFATSCGCVQVQPQEVTLAPGARATLQLQLDLTHNRPAAGPQEPRPFRIQLSPILAGSAERVVAWELGGRVKPVFKMQPRVVNYGELVLGETPEARVVEVQSATPLREVAVTCDQRNLQAKVISPAKPFRGFALEVALTAQGSTSGSFRLPILLHAVGLTGGKLPAQELAVVGQWVDDIEVVPSEVAAGVQPVGRWFEESLCFRSRTGKAIRVAPLMVKESAVRIETLTRELPSSCTVRMASCATSLGEQVHEVKFRVWSELDEVLSEVVVPIRYYGMKGG